MMASTKFPIYATGKIDYIEQDAAQEKAWLVHAQLGSCLFKESTIESTADIQTDWSEKIAYELAQMLYLPAAQYQLADALIDEDYDLVRGSISCDYTVPGAVNISAEKLMIQAYPNYNENQSQFYTVDRVLDAFQQNQVQAPSGYDLPPGIGDGAETFVGYLMFDAVIGNCDRHDQNFEIQVLSDGRKELAPTYDHGQALGASLMNADRLSKTTADYQNYLGGNFYVDGTDITSLEAFEIAASRYPQAAIIWQERLAQITPEQVNEIFNRLPVDRITPLARKFAEQVIRDGREQVLSLDLKAALTPKIYQPTLGELSTAAEKFRASGDLVSIAKVDRLLDKMMDSYAGAFPPPDNLRSSEVKIAPGELGIKLPGVKIKLQSDIVPNQTREPPDRGRGR